MFKWFKRRKQPVEQVSVAPPHADIDADLIRAKEEEARTKRTDVINLKDLKRETGKKK